MSSHSYSFKARTNLLLSAALLGVLVAGWSERPNEVAKPENASSCANPGAPMKLFAAKYDQASKQGWYVNGPSFPEQKKDVPMGRFDNQIVVELPIESGATAARIKLQVSGTVPTAGIILDTIWHAGAKEVGRSAPSI